jgi:hypothetical protein
LADPALDEFLRRLERQLGAVRQPDRRRILRGVRTHLEAEARREAARGAGRGEAMARALAPFGDPGQLRLTLGPGASIVRREGEVVLSVDEALLGADQRTLRSATRWTLAFLGGLLLVAVALAAVAALVGYDLTRLYRTEVVEAVPRPLYSYEASWSQVSPSTNVVEEAFTLPDHASSFRIRFTTSPELGCAAIQLVSPSGQETAVNGSGCSAYNEESWFGQPGTWRVRYAYAAFAGTVRAQAVWHEAA